MGKYDDNFFEKKRVWSIIKDQILKDYLPAYISKVKDLRRPIALIDGYAGPGNFEDGREGSPLIICSAAEQYAKGNYSAYFFNIKKEYHDKLEATIRDKGWSYTASCYQKNSLKHIKEIPQTLEDHTVFLYLDPFGLRGCGFDQLEPYLTRSSKYSTEIVLTMCMPVVHRLATSNAVKRGQTNKKNERYHQTLSSVFGGDYWKDILYQDNIEAEEKELQLIEAYLAKLKQYLPYVGFCPVRKKSDGRIKYFIVFLSRHPGTMILMNDIMYKAYFSNMHKADSKGTLFEVLDWEDMPLPEESNLKILGVIIEDLISRHPGETRDSIWLTLVQENFMRYNQKLYRDMLKKLSQEKKINYIVDPATKRHNGESKLFPIYSLL